jgi:hypothetical protein
VHTDRLALVVLECPRCGKVAIALNGSHWRTINTYAATVRHKVVLIEPRFARRVATVALTDADGRTMVIDGLAIAHN